MRSEALEDLEVFLDAYEHHPGRYLYRTRAALDSIELKLAESIRQKDSISYDEFYLSLLQTLIFLKDAHTDLSRGPRYSANPNSTSLLPFRYKIIGDEVYITDTLAEATGDLLFSKILAIDSIPVETLLDYFFKYTTADNDNELYKRRFNERIFGRNYNFFFEQKAEYLITVCTLSGDTIEKNIQGIENYKLKADPLTPPLLTSFDLENDLAILTVNTFNYRRIVEANFDFHEFIDTFFAKVRKYKIGNLVVDLRDNYGGSSVLAMSLYAYLAADDFAWIDHSFTDLDGSEDFTMFTQHPNGDYPFFNSHDTIRVGSRLKLTNGPDSKETISATEIPFGPKQKRKNITKNKYYGDLYVLTSGITFSAGSIFAAKCIDRENTILIGEPTGSAAGIFCAGGFLSVSLPNSEFRFNLPVMERHVAISSPDIDPYQPLNPNYLTSATLSDLIDGIDTELKVVYELLQKERN